jgi:hypothetical protein
MQDFTEFFPRMPAQLEPDILKQEVEQAIKTSACNKAAGIDGITSEVIKAGGEIIIYWLTHIFNKAWKERTVPADWQKAVEVHLEEKRKQERLRDKQGNIPLESRR